MRPASRQRLAGDGRGLLFRRLREELNRRGDRGEIFMRGIDRLAAAP